MLTCVWPVLLMCGPIFCEPPSGVMPRLYFSRDLEETEKEEQDMPEKAETMVEFQSERPALVPMFTADKGGQTGPRGGIHVLHAYPAVSYGTLEYPTRL